MTETNSWLIVVKQSLLSVGLKLEHVLVTLLILALAIAVVFFVRRSVRRALKRARSSLKFDVEYALAAERAITFTMWIVVAIVVFEYWGLQLTALWTAIVSILSVVGIGLLATWTIASNFTAGALISLTRPFHLGDRIEVLPEGVRGRAIERTLLFTVVEQEDGQLVSIPNSLLFQRIFRCEPGKHRFDYDDYQNDAGQAQNSAAEANISSTANSFNKE